MTDKKKQPESRRTEDLSPAELRAQIEEDKKKVSRSTVFLFAALIAIIVICIAWFVANTRVNVTTGTISAQDSTLFELASVGSRTEAEKSFLKTPLLAEGMMETEYDTYYELEDKNWSPVKKNQTYYVGTADLAWHLDSKETKLTPGASGELEFYIIPKTDNLKSVTVDLEATAYENNNNTAGKLENDVVQNLLKGHLLLFKSRNKTSGYGGWIQDGKLTLQASDAADTANMFKKNVPYKVTIYWVWPKYFRNYIYNSRTLYEDLFENIDENSDYENLLRFVTEQANAEWKENKLFYNAEPKGEPKPDITGQINSTMPETTLNICSDYYNQADEYIGKNADFIYINAEATAQ